MRAKSVVVSGPPPGTVPSSRRSVGSLQDTKPYSEGRSIQMRRLVVFGVFATLLAGPAMVSAADKSQSTMMQPAIFGAPLPAPLVPPASATWVNGDSKGKAKIGPNCKVSVKLSRTALADSDGTPGTGDEVICVVDLISAFFGAPVSLVVRGETRNGAMKINADTATETPPVLCIGAPTEVIRSACYEPVPYAPLLAIPFASDATQGFTVPGGYAPRPASGLIATEGLLQ